MENNPILNSQNIEKKDNLVRDTYDTPAPKKKSMYVLNLDGSRIFWMISIVLLLLTFVLLLGYWVGSDSTVNQTVDPNSRQIAGRTGAAQTPAQSNTPEGLRITEERLASSSQVEANTSTAGSQTQARPNNQSNSGNLANSHTGSNNQESSAIDNINSMVQNQPASNTRVKQRKRIARRSESTRETNNDSDRETARQRISRMVDTVGSDKFMTERKPYAVQIATHTSLRGASSIKKKLKNDNHSAYILLSKTRKGKKLYKVRVGTFKSREIAMKHLETLRNTSYGRSSIIVHR